MDDSRVPASEIKQCPQCHSVSVAFDFSSCSQVCHQCGWEADGDFETLGRVIGGGPESGRVEIRVSGALGQEFEDAYGAGANTGDQHKTFLNGVRDSKAIYRVSKALEAEGEIERLCKAVRFPDLTLRARGILGDAKRKFAFQWGKYGYPYIVASIIVAARENKRGVHIVDFLPFIPQDTPAKSIFHALLKVGEVSRHREPSVFVQRIFNHLSLYTGKRFDGTLIHDVDPTSPQFSSVKKLRDERNLPALKDINIHQARDLAERLTLRFDAHSADPATLAVAATLIAIEHQTFGKKASQTLRNRDSLAADLVDAFMGALSVQTCLNTARGILLWIERTWKLLSLERGWTLNTKLIGGNDVAHQKHWKRNVALSALRHVDLLPLPDETDDKICHDDRGNVSGENHYCFKSRAKLVDYIKPRGANRQECKARKVRIAAGTVKVNDKERHLLHDPDVIHYRRLLFEGYSVDDILQDKTSTNAPPSSGSLAAFAAELGMTTAELVRSDHEIPDDLLFDGGDQIMLDGINPHKRKRI